MSAPRDRPVCWVRSDDAVCPYAASVDGQHWVIRLGDFPAQALYTLLIDDVEIESFDDWPTVWQRPTA